MPTRIRFNKTDGDPSTWPKCGKLKEGGRLDRLPPDDGNVVLFLEKVAVQLAQILGYGNDADIQIDGLPEGYSLFNRSNGCGRQDRYLRGSRYVSQFRSPVEFAPHAAWLLTDPLLTQSNCECKYCHKRTGRLQNTRGQSVGIKSPTPTSSRTYPRLFSPPLRPPLALPPARRYAGSVSSRASERSIRGTSRPIRLYKTSLSRGDDEWNAPLPAQSSDLAALAQGRLYRDQELIWYILDKPLRITVPSCPEMDCTIRLWPGVLRTIDRPPPPAANKHEKTEDATVSYLVTIPSVRRTYLVPQTSVIPFQAYRLNEDLLVELRSMDKEVPLNEVDHAFDPLPRSSTLETPVSLETATESSPLELLLADVRITKRVAYFWTATDDHSPPDPNEPKPTVLPPPSLQGSSQHVVKSLTPSGGSTDRGYRGLWWGAERVWVGDLLRLSFPENQLDYARIDPSYFANGVHAERLSSEGGHVFLKLSALIPLATEMGNEMYATGRLYKLTRSPTSTPIDQPELEENLGLLRPPERFSFRPMLSTDIEARFSVNLIKGRYYPRLLSSVDGRSVPDECRTQAMEGLSSIDSAAKGPVKYWEGTRETTIDAARSRVLG